MKIQEHVKMHLVPLENGAWVHSHGLWELGLPELEMKGIPLFLMKNAGGLLNHIAQYMHDHKDGEKPVKVGQNFATDHYTVVKFIPATPMPDFEDHYAQEVWEVVVDMDHYEKYVCALCDAERAKQKNTQKN